MKTRIDTRLKVCLLSLILLFVADSLWAQRPGGGKSRFGNVKGRFYGKLVDKKGKGISYASVQLWGMSFDSVSRKPTPTLLAGQLSASNGDFDLTQIPVRRKYTLKISLLGYAPIEQKVSFFEEGEGAGGRPNGGQRSPSGQGRSFGGSFADKLDKDLGNITLKPESLTLDEVVIEGEASAVVLAMDRKIFRVDNNAIAQGGTAIDALNNVPSLTVDLDGNLSLRNASPQLFVDGRPTNLTLEQIPADAIETVEVITNPSAKYDASGSAGIVNIVLKKDKRIGYYGNLRAGIDTQTGYNLGVNLNAQEGKFNAFMSVNLNSRVSIGDGTTIRENFFGTPLTNIRQESENEFRGTFTSVRGGVDWFIDNRSTLTLSGNFTRGDFKPEELLTIRTDSIFPGRTAFSESVRDAVNDRSFQNIGASVLYKYLFPKKGRELTADINYNNITIDRNNNIETVFQNIELDSRERQISEGETQFLVLQTDYVDPITKNIKLEAGLRAAIRRFDNTNISSVFDESANDFVRIPNFADVYKFDDQVYAAYTSVSHQLGKFGYMLGLRVESSQYTGDLPESGQQFENDFPFSVFPSVFTTYKINEEDNLQLSYTRRINRPNFFQLLPFTDFSDSLNLRRGNPDLLPEFTNAVELSYQNILSKGNDFLVSVYFKQARDLITRDLFPEFIPELEREVLVSSYSNSNNSEAYGMEFTMRNTFWKNIELVSNINLYNSVVDATNVEDGRRVEQFSWFLKENLTIKLPAQFRLQISAEYRSRAAFTPDGGGGRFRGFRGTSNTAQGFSREFWYVDAAIRKDLMKRKASITVQIRDIFRSRETGSTTQSDFFFQESWRLRNPQVVALRFSYRFGKPNLSLFKRKNNKVNMAGSDMMN